MLVEELSVIDLQPRVDARQVIETRVEELKKSIVANGGLINPIRVRNRDFYYEVTAGWHRTVACRQLGWLKVPCVVVDDDDLRAELAMIDENIVRTNLSPVDEARQFRRRKEIYEALFPEASASRKRARGMNVSKGNRVTEKDTASFTSSTAAATGKSEREVQRIVRRGKINPSALELVKKTRLHTKEFLDELAGVLPEEQFMYAADAINRYRPPPTKNPISRAYESATERERDEFFAEIGYRLPWPSISAP